MKQPIKKEIKQEYNLKDIKPRVNKSKKKKNTQTITFQN